MIYTLTKNGHTSTLIIELGDLRAKRKLFNYRQRGWQVSAREGNHPANRQPKQQPNCEPKCEEKIVPKVTNRRTKVLGQWIEVD